MARGTNYTLPQDRFYPLLDDIEAQGGFRENRDCKGNLIKDESGSNAAKTHGCRKMYIVSIPYDRLDGEVADVVVCAEGDCVELWPRFQQEEDE